MGFFKFFKRCSKSITRIAKKMIQIFLSETDGLNGNPDSRRPVGPVVLFLDSKKFHL